MATKLTLSINEDVIKKAKQVSRRRGQSLSKMVEEYLQTFTEKEVTKKLSVNILSGVLKDKMPENVDLKKVKGEYLKKKYGV